MSEKEKPATQSVAATGIDAHGAMGQATGSVDLQQLANYPPFQMFIETHIPNEQGINSVTYALERGQAAYNLGGQDFIDQYLTWWNEMGYWKGEDPMGCR